MLPMTRVGRINHKKKCVTGPKAPASAFTSERPCKCEKADGWQDIPGRNLEGPTVYICPRGAIVEVLRPGQSGVHASPH